MSIAQIHNSQQEKITLTPQNHLILALDIGGTWLRTALGDKGGRILSRRALVLDNTSSFQ